MKNTVKMLLSYMLALALLLSGGALAAPGNANLGRNVQDEYGDYLNGGAVCGDTLYLKGYQNIFSWKLGEADLTPLPFHLESPGPNYYSDMGRIFSDGEKLYGLVTVNYSSETSYALEACSIVELIPDGDKISFGESVEVDTSELLVDWGGGDQLMQVNSICCQGDYACMQVYDANGNSTVYCLDITTGTGFFAEGEELNMVTPYADGCFLITSYDYMNSQQRLLIFDPESESMTEACDPITMETYLSGLAYSQESGRLFYLDGGYIYAVQDFDFESAQPVAELSLQYNSGEGGMLLPGDYYVCSGWDVTAVRSTSPEDMPEQQIVVDDSSYSDSVMDAYYSFSNTRGDVAVVISHDYAEDSKIIEAMMNRDAAADIYVMNVSRQAYDALFERGYMLGLNENETIRTAVEGMYPGIQQAVIRDGEIVGVPVQTYGWIMGVNQEVLELLDMDYDELPDNWPDFLDWLAELPDLLPEDGSVRVFDNWMTQGDVRYSLFDSIMTSYNLWLNQVGLERGYDTPELRTMLEKLMAIDFSAFGLPEEYNYEDEGEVYFYESNVFQYLLQTSVGCTIGNFFGGQMPMLLAVSGDYEPMLPLDMSVAFINPFSQNAELAMEFLAEIYTNLDDQTIYNLSDAFNEPKRSRGYEDFVKDMNENIAEMEKQLETAEAVDVPMLEENIANMKQNLEENDRYWWEISPESIEWYRANGEYIAVERYNYLYGDGSYELWELNNQFLNGATDLDSYLKDIDRKATMMAMEGN